MLEAKIETLAETLLGAPSLRKPRTWRWGSKGALAVELHGRKRGRWYDHEAGKGGGPFDLVAHARFCSMASAIAWSRSWAGGETMHIEGPRARASSKDDAADVADRARRIQVAQGLWRGSTPAAATLAVTYLETARGIRTPAAGWPDAVRFHAPTRSLIVAATTADGAVQAVQRVRLTPEGRKDGTPDQPAKTTNGVLAGAVVRLPGDTAGPLLLAEGPEGGLSVWAATGYETWITLGSLKVAEPPASRLVVIARDDDLSWSPPDRKLRELVTARQAAGGRIIVASPWPERRGDKSDFNDVIRTSGAEAVRQRIAIALAPVTASVARRPVKAARRAMGEVITPFFDAAGAFDPDGEAPLPVHAVKADVGLGKSYFARDGAVRLLILLRQGGDPRSVTFSVPTHALGQEAAAELEAMPAARAAGLTAAIWRGRRADDPDRPGQAMCLDLERGGARPGGGAGGADCVL